MATGAKKLARRPGAGQGADYAGRGAAGPAALGTQVHSFRSAALTGTSQTSVRSRADEKGPRWARWLLD